MFLLLNLILAFAVLRLMVDASSNSQSGPARYSGEPSISAAFSGSLVPLNIPRSFAWPETPLMGESTRTASPGQNSGAQSRFAKRGRSYGC